MMIKKQLTNIQLSSKFQNKPVNFNNYVISERFKQNKSKIWGSGKLKFRKSNLRLFSLFKAILDKRENRHFFFKKTLSAKFFKIKCFNFFFNKSFFFKKTLFKSINYLKTNNLYKFIPRFNHIFLKHNQLDYSDNIKLSASSSLDDVKKTTLIWRKKETSKNSLFYYINLYKTYNIIYKWYILKNLKDLYLKKNVDNFFYRYTSLILLNILSNRFI